MAKSNETTNMEIVERVAKLEERVDLGMEFLKGELKEIKDNHLHTLQKDVSDLKIQVNTLMVKIGIIVSAAVIAIELAMRLLEKTLLK